MKKGDFKVGSKFRTSTGEWLVTQLDDFKVMAKPLWRWAAIKEDEGECFDREHFPKNFPAISFTRKHWPACRTVEERKQSKSSKQYKYNRIPCYRCYNNDLAIPTTLLEICSSETVGDQNILRGTTVLVCARCKKPEEKSCVSFGKYKWICQCGTNMWWDDPKTDERCTNCGRDRTFWTAVENE
jgi:hypothetical protein